VTRTSVRSDVALSVVAVCMAAALGEMSVRVYAALDPTFARQVHEVDPLSARIEPDGELGYRQKPNSRYRYRNGTVATSNAIGFRGPLVARPKPPETFRIVLLGESTTHGWEVNDDETIDAYMRRALAGRYPARRFDVVNLAFDGYDSNQLYERLRSDGLGLEPDLLIVNAGINDVRNARLSDLKDRDPRTVLFGRVLSIEREAARHGVSAWTWMKRYSYLARLPGMARTRLVTPAIASTRGMTPNPRAVDFFALNLRRIADLVQRRRTPIVFSTPPSAIPTRYRPGDTSTLSYWLVDAATTQRYRDSLAQRMRQVTTELRRDGRPVTYVRYELPPELFLDDCHLTAEGNQRMAANFIAAAQAFFGEGKVRAGPSPHAASRPPH
jgi:lysophospholipase L1-like esterase